MNSEQKKLICLQRLEMAEKMLNDAKILFGNGSLQSTVNRMYYALFYAVNALSCAHNFKTSKHTGLRAWFNKEIVQKGLIEKNLGAIYNKAFELRSKGDYEDFYPLDTDTIITLLQSTPAFIENIRYLTLQRLEQQDFDDA